MKKEECGCMCHKHEDDLNHTICVCKHCKSKPLKRNGIREINLPALQRIVDAHLLPATIETMKPEDWEWIVQTIDKELTRARAEGAKDRTMKHRKEFRANRISIQCPECNYPFTVKSTHEKY
jgi:Zn finger protein HypA/HybF involved in hydrogenase expression